MATTSLPTSRESMTATTPEFVLSSNDDTLHVPPGNADTWWTETFWFTFAVPERELFVTLPVLPSIAEVDRRGDDDL